MAPACLEEEVKCFPRKYRNTQRCVRPNPWTEFLAHAFQDPTLPRPIRARAVSYRSKKAEAAPILTYKAVGVRATDGPGLCKAFRFRRYQIRSPSPAASPVAPSRAASPAAAVAAIVASPAQASTSSISYPSDASPPGEATLAPVPAVSAERTFELRLDGFPARIVAMAQAWVDQSQLPTFSARHAAVIRQMWDGDFADADAQRSWSKNNWVKDDMLTVFAHDLVYRKQLARGIVPLNIARSQLAANWPTIDEVVKEQLTRYVTQHVASPSFKGFTLFVYLPSHWAYCFWNKANDTFYVMDSLAKGYSSSIKRWVLGVRAFLRSQNLSNRKSDSFVYIDVPNQQDGYSCGIWTAMSAYSFAYNVRYPFEAIQVMKPPAYARQLRRFFACMLLAAIYKRRAGPAERLVPLPPPPPARMRSMFPEVSLIDSDS